MSEVVSLDKRRKAILKAKGKRATLCGNGFHSWTLVKENRFDVKQGRLVTEFHCRRCGAVRTEAT